MLHHHSLRQISPERQQVAYSAKVPLSMPRTYACLALLAVVAVVLAGCGSSGSSASLTYASSTCAQWHSASAAEKKRYASDIWSHSVLPGEKEGPATLEGPGTPALEGKSDRASRIYNELELQCRTAVRSGNAATVELATIVPMRSATPVTATTTASTTSTTSSATAPHGPTFSDTLTIPANSADQFTFQLTAKVTLGAASTNTEGESPPDVNVVAPVSGTATVTNTTAGYKAEGVKIPVISILAFYRVGGPVCGPAGGLQTPRGVMCSIEIASLASGCSGHEIELDSLAPEETGDLTVWPNGAQPMVNETYDPAGSAAGVAGIDGLCAHENAHPADDLRLQGLEAKAADGVVKALAAAPVYWVVADDTEDHNEGNTGCADTSGGNDVVDSQPSGITGCFE